MKYRWIIFTAIVFAIAVYYFKAPSFPKSGDNAPDFILKDPEGAESKLSTLWNDRPIALQFVSVTCATCIQQLNDMSAGRVKYDGYDFVIISDGLINGLNYKIFIDENKHIFNAYNVFVVPQTFLINTNGIVDNRIVGH